MPFATQRDKSSRKNGDNAIITIKKNYSVKQHKFMWDTVEKVGLRSDDRLNFAAQILRIIYF